MRPPFTRKEDSRHIFAGAETEAEFADAVVVAAEFAQSAGSSLRVLGRNLDPTELREWLHRAQIVVPLVFMEHTDDLVAPEAKELVVLSDMRGRPDAPILERSVGEWVKRPGAVGICVYDPRQLNRHELVEVMACHEAILHSLQPRQNPFFAPIFLDSREPPGTKIYRAWLESINQWEAGRKELLRRSQALEQSNADLERFAYLASHDLQEPLRMISGYVELLEREVAGKGGPGVSEYVGEIKQGVRRMRALVTGLLSLSRVSTLPLKADLVEARDAFSDATANLRSLILESGAAIQHGALPLVRIDRAALSQIFQNLISNAIRFRSSLPPRVDVTCRRLGEEWAFAVRDNGRGIPADYHRDLFTPFRVRDPTGGSGLGLVIAKRLVERHGGRIWFEPNPDQGTTFFFSLPVLG